MADWHDESVTVDGHRLHYIEAGAPADPTLVLLHGGIIDAAHISWAETIDPLASEHHVVSLDLLGYGESDKPDVRYSLESHVEVVDGFLEATALAPATVVGTSMGGGIGLGLALRSPGRVDRLALLDSYGLGTDLPNGLLSWLLARVGVPNRIAIALFRRSRQLTRASLANVAHDVDALSESVVDAIWEETKRPGVGKAFRSFRRAEVTRKGYRTDYTDRLSELSMPTLLVHGEHDEVFPPAWSQRATERIPDSELHVLEDCGHLAPLERPDTVVELVTTFTQDA